MTLARILAAASAALLAAACYMAGLAAGPAPCYEDAAAIVTPAGRVCVPLSSLQCTTDLSCAAVGR